MKELEELENIIHCKDVLFLKGQKTIVGIVEILKQQANVDMPEFAVEKLPKLKDLYVYTAVYNKPISGESSNKSYHILKKLQPEKKHVGFLCKQDFLDFLEKARKQLIEKQSIPLIKFT